MTATRRKAAAPRPASAGGCGTQGVNLAPQIAIGQTTHNGAIMPAYLDFFGNDAVRLRRWFATAEGFGAVLVASQYNTGGDIKEQPAPTPAKGAKVAAGGRG